MANPWLMKEKLRPGAVVTALDIVFEFVLLVTWVFLLILIGA